MIRLNNQLLKIENLYIPYIYGLPREQGGRDADMYVRIHYIDQINPKDSTQFTWGVTDPLLIN